MNSEIRGALFEALLANASYVEGLQQGDTGGSLAGRLQQRFTQPLADYVGQNFSVLTQYTDPSALGGFSVTVFQSNASGQRFVSFRGTEGATAVQDLFSDINILFFTGL